jgi:hypothetical protein
MAVNGIEEIVDKIWWCKSGMESTISPPPGCQDNYFGLVLAE